jgi:hypothetical protein
LFGEAGSIGAALGQLLHPDDVPAEGAPVRLVEDLTRVAGAAAGVTVLV